MAKVDGNNLSGNITFGRIPACAGMTDCGRVAHPLKKTTRDFPFVITRSAPFVLVVAKKRTSFPRRRESRLAGGSHSAVSSRGQNAGDNGRRWLGTVFSENPHPGRSKSSAGTQRLFAVISLRPPDSRGTHRDARACALSKKAEGTGQTSGIFCTSPAARRPAVGRQKCPPHRFRTRHRWCGGTGIPACPVQAPGHVREPGVRAEGQPE